MTVAAFVSDLHITNHKRFGGDTDMGLNDRCRLTIATLRRACWEAADRKASRLYVAGDLFDHVSPGPRVVAAVQDVVAESKGRGCTVVIMPGNHDQISADPGNHALGPLRYLAHVVDRPYVDRLGDLEVILIPHRPGPAAQWLRGAIAKAEGRDPITSEDRKASPSTGKVLRPFRVLALHLGISTSSAPSYLRSDPSSIDRSALALIADEFDIDLVVSGHWHDLATYNLGDAKAVQLGALAPAGWGDAGVEDRGRMLVLNGQVVESVEIPGPRFIRVKGVEGATEIEETAARAVGCQLFVEWLVHSRDASDVRDDLRLLIERGTVYRGSVMIDVGGVNETARDAAEAARSSDSLSEALGRYVGRMNLPEGVDRQKVLELARRFTGIA